MENVYCVQIGTQTKKGHFQPIITKVVRTNNSEAEIQQHFKEKYAGLFVIMSKVETIEMEYLDSGITKGRGETLLVNKQCFDLEVFLTEDQLNEWKAATKMKNIVDEKARNAISLQLEKRIEVKGVRQISISQAGGFSCEIVISGELWKI